MSVAGIRVWTDSICSLKWSAKTNIRELSEKNVSLGLKESLEDCQELKEFYQKLILYNYEVCFSCIEEGKKYIEDYSALQIFTKMSEMVRTPRSSDIPLWLKTFYFRSRIKNTITFSWLLGALAQFGWQFANFKVECRKLVLILLTNFLEL